MPPPKEPNPPDSAIGIRVALDSQYWGTTREYMIAAIATRQQIVITRYLRLAITNIISSRPNPFLFIFHPLVRS